MSNLDFLTKMYTFNCFKPDIKLMSLTNYLKSLFSELIDSYRKYFIRTSGIVLAYTIICFIVVALLSRFSNFDPTNYKKQISLLSYFSTNYSAGNTYGIVDLTSIVFLFFVSIFSISLIRWNKDDGEEFKLEKSLKNVKMNDIISFLLIFLICSIIDFLLFKTERFLVSIIEEKGFAWWVHNLLLFPMRNFIPWTLFSLTIYKVITSRTIRITFKTTWLLFIAFWIINAFAYEFSLYVKFYLFDLILIPVNIEKRFYFESILGISLIGSIFIGYYAVMTASVKLLDEDKPEGIEFE
jgi:hypothetical protein